MKILAIRGRNLASLEGDFDIDFNKEPLKSAGIFAITGATGAGKSTLLDALCLALYNKTPRMKQDAEKVEMTDVGKHTLSSTHPGSILRKGTAEGMAEVEFIALNHKTYRARWSVARAHRKETGKLQIEEISLYNITDDIAESGKKVELLKRIVELIGLTFEQFTRTVLLAQGDFATFLKANSAEKAELLEKLTGTEIYAELSATIFRKFKDAKEALDSLENQVNAVALLSDDEINTLKEQIEQLIRLETKSRQNHDAITKQLEQQVITNKLKNEIDVLQKRLAVTLQQQESYTQRTEMLGYIVLVEQIKTVVSELETAKKQSDLLNNEVTQAQNKYKTIANNLNEATQQNNKALIELEKVNKRYAEIQPELIKSRELATRYKEQEQQLQALTKLYNENTRKYNSISVNCDKLNKQISDNTKNGALHETWLAEHAHYGAILLQLDQIRELVANQTTYSKQIKQLSEEKNTLQQIISSTRTKIESANKIIQQLKETSPTEALILRAQLQDGKPCPVCGSTHHPLTHTEANTSQTMEVEKLEEKLKAANNIVETNNSLIAQNEKIIIATDTNITNLNSLLAANQAKLAQYIQLIPEGPALLENGTLITTLESIHNQQTKTKDAKTVLEKKFLELNGALVAEKRVMEELKPIITEQSLQIKAITSAIQELKQQRSVLFDGQEPEQIENKFTTYVSERTLIVNRTLTEKNTLLTKLEVETARIERLNKEITQNNENKKNATQAINTWLQEQNNAYINEHFDTLLTYSTQWLIDEQKAINTYKEELVKINTILNDQQKRLTEQLKNYPDITSEQQKELAAQLELLDKQIAEDHTERAKAEGRVTINEENKKIVARFDKELKAKQLQKENWGKLNELLGQSDGSKFKKIAQQYTLDTLLLYANRQLEMLTNRYRLERNPDPDLLVLQVVDSEMMDEIRPVKTLSGGETFLISLALALGLSSLSSRRMTVESLFIDEGFGSLDPQTLTIAIEALERLHMQGRKIGVISHVAEMNERISTRIEIIKSSGGRSHIHIVG
ncbi:MAG: AAA family ATPase [Marinifilaceae bacterium]